jgi:hypothetical protein
MLLAGCAALAPEAANSTVALVASPEPARLRIIINKLPENGGSFERSLMFASEILNMERDLAAALQPPAFAPAAALTDAFAAALQKPGRTVVRAANPSPEREDFLKDYAKLGVKASIYVDIIPRAVGFWSDLPAGPYRPWIVVAYRLFDIREGKILATGLLGTGPPPFGETMTSVAQDDSFAFPSYAAVIEDPVRAAAGLRATMAKVAQALPPQLPN